MSGPWTDLPSVSTFWLSYSCTSLLNVLPSQAFCFFGKTHWHRPCGCFALLASVVRRNRNVRIQLSVREKRRTETASFKRWNGWNECRVGPTQGERDVREHCVSAGLQLREAPFVSASRILQRRVLDVFGVQHHSSNCSLSIIPAASQVFVAFNLSD